MWLVITMLNDASVEEWYSAKKRERETGKVSKNRTEWSLNLRNKGVGLDDLERPIRDL